MFLVLAAVVVFIGTGLVSARLTWRQTMFFVIAAVALAATQLTQRRFL